MGWCGRQNMLWPYLKLWDCDWILAKHWRLLSLWGVRSPCFLIRLIENYQKKWKSKVNCLIESGNNGDVFSSNCTYMEIGLAETLTWKLCNHEKSSKEWDMAPHSSSTPSSSRRKEKQLEDSLGWILLTPIVQFPPVTRELPFCHIGLFVFLKHKSKGHPR